MANVPQTDLERQNLFCPTGTAACLQSSRVEDPAGPQDVSLSPPKKLSGVPFDTAQPVPSYLLHTVLDNFGWPHTCLEFMWLDHNSVEAGWLCVHICGVSSTLTDCTCHLPPGSASRYHLQTLPCVCLQWLTVALFFPDRCIVIMFNVHIVLRPQQQPKPSKPTKIHSILYVPLYS